MNKLNESLHDIDGYENVQLTIRKHAAIKSKLPTFLRLLMIAKITIEFE